MIAERYVASHLIREHLRQGGIVIADRWMLSGEIYGMADGLPRELIAAAQDGLPVLDLTFILVAPFEVLTARARARGVSDRFERQDFQRKVAAAYAGLPSRRDRVFLDAAAPQEQIATRIVGEVAAFLRRCWA